MLPHLEYPRHLHKPGGAVLVVRSDEEKSAGLAAGWSLLPVSDAPVADAAGASEAPKRGPGRPKKDAAGASEAQGA